MHVGSEENHEEHGGNVLDEIWNGDVPSKGLDLHHYECILFEAARAGRLSTCRKAVELAPCGCVSVIVIDIVSYVVLEFVIGC